MSSSDELQKYDEIIKNCEEAIENCEDAIARTLFLMSGREDAKAKYIPVDAATGEEIPWDDLPDDREALLAQLYAHRKALCKALCDKGILYGRSGRSDEAYKAEQMNLDSVVNYLEYDLDTPIEIKQTKIATGLISKLRDISYKIINARKNTTETIWNKGEWLTKCMEYDELCDYDKAIVTCDNAIKSFDDLLEKSDDIQKNNIKIILGYSWTVKGIELSKLGKSEKAIKSYDKAIELHPAVIAWVAKGYELSKLGKSIEAIEAYNNMLYHIFDEPTTLFNLGVEYSKIDPCKAIETYEICIEEIGGFLCDESCFNKGIEIGKMEFEHESLVKCGNIKEVTNQYPESIKQLPNGTLIKFRYKQSEYVTQVNASDYEYPTLNRIFYTRGIYVNIWAHIYARYLDENGHWLPLDNLRT